eukprot:TRINITY_DN7758_c0_g2_i1.p1 TRINITY_DN7758_c0_g2~~TRINITY_DN7758_c0_g2_i1.p1  ORF type:complete len:503 (+),score=75.25 TRINITY_DN7758_c0_g2_i1:67-1509(+)
MSNRITKVAMPILVILIILVLVDRNSSGLFGQQQASTVPMHVKWENTLESLGEVQDLLIGLGFSEYFTILRNNGFTNIHILGSNVQTEPPPGIRKFHWRTIRKEAIKQTQPSVLSSLTEQEGEPDVPATDAQLQKTICQSWANTEGIHAFMKKTRKLPTGTFANITIPACSGPNKLPPRGVLYGVNEDSTQITTTVGTNGGWYPNTITLNQVRDFETRGITSQFVFDHELKLAFCGAPKAGYTLTKAWMLQAAGLWDIYNASAKSTFANKRITSGRHLKSEQIMSILNSGEYFKFTLVRDPFTRVLASYHDRISECTQKSGASECKQWYRSLGGVSRWALKGSIDFRDYIGLMKNLKNKVTNVDVTFLTGHWLPQTSVCALDKIAYDFIGRMESEDVDHQLLYDIVGKQGMTARQRRALDKSQNTKLHIHHYGSDSATVRENINSVTQLFEEDIRQLGYDGKSLVSYLESGSEIFDDVQL